MRTIGNRAEVPSRGVNLNALVKSGGNDFHSSISYNKTPVGTQADNIDDKLRAQGIGTGNAIADRHSMSADLGGRIIRDKLWFYTAWRRQIDDQAPLNTFMPDGTTPAVAHELAWFNTNKISWQMSPSNKIIGFYAFNHKYDTSNLSQYIPWDSRGGLMTPSKTEKIEWQKLYGSKLVMATWHNTIPDFPELSVGVTYLPIPVGGVILFCFVAERLWLGPPPVPAHEADAAALH